MSGDAFCYFKAGAGNGPAIEGETTDKKLAEKKAFALNTFTIKGENSTNIGSSTGGAGGAGKVKFDKLTMEKESDKATVALFKAMSMGGHYDEVVIELRRNGETFLKYSFMMCIVAEMEMSGGTDEESSDSLTVDYGAVKIEYYAQDAAGALKPAGDMVWSRVLNENNYAIK